MVPCVYQSQSWVWPGSTQKISGRYTRLILRAAQGALRGVWDSLPLRSWVCCPSRKELALRSWTPWPRALASLWAPLHWWMKLVWMSQNTWQKISAKTLGSGLQVEAWKCCGRWYPRASWVSSLREMELAPWVDGPCDPRTAEARVEECIFSTEPTVIGNLKIISWQPLLRLGL